MPSRSRRRPPAQKAKGQATSTTTSVHHHHDRRPDPPRPATAAAAPKPQTPDQAASDARESLADHLNKHTTLLIVGGMISTIGVLGLVFGMIYTNLWCMRVGLVTRFWGALGMAFGLFLVIPLFPPIPGLVLWFAVTGLMFTGLWPRPLPPAWAAGEAIPWQRPGDDLGPPPAERGPAGTVEGSGREVSEPPLPDNGGGNGEPPEPPYGRDPGAAAQEAQAPGLVLGRRGSRHELHAMAARGDREGTVRTPELAGVLDLEARVAEPLLGLGVIGRDHGGVPERRCGVALGEDQVDLRRVALEPADGVAEHVSGRDLLEAEQAPELRPIAPPPQAELRARRDGARLED